MTKEQQRKLEDLRFEIEKTKLEIEYYRARAELFDVLQGQQPAPAPSKPAPTAPAPPSKPAPTAPAPTAPAPPSKPDEIVAIEKAIEEKARQLNEVVQSITETKAEKRRVKTKEQKELLQGFIDERIKENVAIGAELNQLRQQRRELYAKYEARIGF